MRISQPAGEVALLLRHRLRHPRRADRQRAVDVDEICASIGADSPRLHLARGAGRGDRRCRWTTCAGPASTASTRSTLPEPELLGKHLLEIGAACSTADGAGDLAGRRRRRRRARAAHEPADELRGDATPPPASRSRPATGRRADEGVGREGPPPRDDRRHRRLRRALRRQRAQGATTGRCSPRSTDGVGTKVAIAQALDKHDTIGFDLVGMLVDDLVVCGAEPLFLTDYIATAGSCPSGSRRSSRASPRPASRPAAR